MITNLPCLSDVRVDCYSTINKLQSHSGYHTGTKVLWRMCYYSHVVCSCMRWKWGHNLESNNGQSQTKRACLTAGECVGQQPVKGVVVYLMMLLDRAWLYWRQQQGEVTAADARKRDRVAFCIAQGLGMTSEQSVAARSIPLLYIQRAHLRHVT